MNQPKRLFLILGDQLDLQGAGLKGFNPESDEIIMIESANEASYVWSHKAKIVLLLSAMRHFAKILRDLRYPLTYIKESPLSIVEALSHYLLERKIATLVCVEPGEWRLRVAIEEMSRDLGLHLEMREDDHFFCSHQEFLAWADGKKELRLEYFYCLMRETHDILMDVDGNPEGGQWNFDQDNRKSYPKNGPGMIDAPISFVPDEITRDVFSFVASAYSSYPGSLEHFQWPVTREQALQALEYFVEYRLRNFGVYQDAMWTDCDVD